jgi:hypothetical protein
MRGIYLGGYPWRDTGILTAADLNAAIALALSPVSVIPPGSITNAMLQFPWVQIGSTQINLGATVATLHGVLDPLNDLDVANKHYVDQFAGTGGGGGGISDAPADGTWYGRFNATWAHVVPLAGGVTITGTLQTNGRLTASGALTVAGGETLSGGLNITDAPAGTPPLLVQQTAGSGLPTVSGNAMPASLMARMAGNAGPVLDFGTNGVSGMWLEATNSSDLTQHYPLLLQPVGGDTRIGGNATVAGTTVLTGALTANGGIVTTTLVLTTPLPISSGGTNSAAQALPPPLPGIAATAWSSVVEISNGTQIIPASGALGYVAKTAAYDLNIIGAANVPVLRMARLNGTLAAPTPMALNDIFAAYQFWGWNGSAMAFAAQMQAQATQAWTTTAQGSRIIFNTTGNNFNTSQATLTLDQDGSGTLRGNFSQGGPYHYLGGGTGVINGTGGPLFYADTANTVIKIGSGNGAVLIQNYAGTNVIQLPANGGIVCAGINTQNGGVAAGTGPIGGGSLTLGGGGAAVINVTSGGITVAGTSTFQQGIILNGTGNSVLNVTNGGIHVVGSSQFDGGLILTSNGGIQVQGSGSVTIGGSLTVTGGVAANGGFTSTTMGAVSLQLSGGGVSVLNVTSGGITVAGTSTFQQSILANGTGDSVLSCPNGGITVAAINATQVNCFGNAYKPGGGVWSDNSDSRLKQNVTNYTTGLAAVTALNPVTYEFNGLAGTVTGVQHIGLIADDVQSIMPEMVSTRQAKLHPEDATVTDLLTLNSTALLFALVNAVKELTARLAVLEAK